MSSPILLVSTTTKWYGAARSPRALAKAGFTVSLLAPRNALAEKSRYLTKVGHLPDHATPLEWTFAFAAMVKATAPRMVLPCDDMSFRLLQMLVLAPPDGMQPALQLQLATLIRDSLGDPNFYRASVDKMLLPPAAKALGVRVPPWLIVREAAEAERFAATHGYPVVSKRNHTTAGEGVAICANAAELARALEEFRRPEPLALEAGFEGEVLLQAHITGRIQFYQLTAWGGSLISGWLAERMLGHPEPKGPATVVRLRRSPEMRDACERLVRGFGMVGTASVEFIADERTGTPYLLEINRRVSPGWHQGAYVNVDACAALYAAMHGTALTTRRDLDDGEEKTICHFPQEWLRDPGSPNLRMHRVDVPWDEPELIEAMLALRHEG